MDAISHIKIGKRKIGPGEPCYIVAEAGLTHLGSLDLALSILEDVRISGAEAFKTQVFAVESKTHRIERALSYKSLVQIKEAIGSDLHFILTPHDLYGVGAIRDIGVDAVKLGSGAKGNLELVRAVAALGKPVIASLGGYKEDDLSLLLDNLEGCNVALLHCVSRYPVPVEEADLGKIAYIRTYGRLVGYSDHCKDEMASCIAVALGACIIERHVMPSFCVGVKTSMDQKVSIRANEFRNFVLEIRATERMIDGPLGSD